MNKMKEVAELLGVELNERFKICDRNNRLTDDCLYYLDGNGLNIINTKTVEHYRDVEIMFQALLTGQCKVIKLFKPKYGDTYWTVCFESKIGNYYIDCTWTDDDFDYMRYNHNNCFRTEEEITKEVMERVRKEVKEKYGE